MGKPRWKREVFPDHKFDFIDINEFKSHGILLWAGYLWVFIDILKSLAVYVLDTQTGMYTLLALLILAIFLLAFNKWATQVQPAIPMSISRWIFSGCIIFSFLLLAKDWWTARKIIRSRDISFAYTNLIGIFLYEEAHHSKSMVLRPRRIRVFLSLRQIRRESTCMGLDSLFRILLFQRMETTCSR
jgi:hypothetical protein